MCGAGKQWSECLRDREQPHPLSEGDWSSCSACLAAEFRLDVSNLALSAARSAAGRLAIPLAAYALRYRCTCAAR